MYFFLHLLLLLGLLTITSAADQDVLTDLRKGVIDPTGALNWGLSSVYCNWTGIQCNQQGRVFSISVGNKNLRGSITPLLGQLEYLTIFNMEINNLTGSIPSSLENCSRLANISLGSNQLSGVIPRSLTPGLHRLDLWDNRLEGPIPASLGNCTDMDYLSLGQNFLEGEIPQELGKLANLQILRLFTNKFVGEFPKFLTNCTRLQIISIRNNSLTGSIPDDIDRLSELQQLRIQSNRFTGIIPPQIGNMTSLYYMDISLNQLSGSIPSSFGKLVNIQEIYLNHNKLSGTVPSEVSNCTKLSSLDLSYNLLEGLPDRIGDMQGLTNLTIDHNRLTGGIPIGIGMLYRLINLDLSYNLFTGKLPSTLASLHQLQIAFNVAHNRLDGIIPSWLGNFPTVQNISLAYNNFSGRIPEALGQCVGLNVLDLSGNKLSGPIPEVLGSLTALRILDLSSNELSGGIPSSFTSLSSLIRLNLSMNDLQGPIPTGGRFGLFGKSSFLGNSKLCGKNTGIACSSIKAGNSKSKSKTIAISVAVAVIAFLIIFISVCGCYRWYSQSNLDDQAVPMSSGAITCEGPLILFTKEELSRMTQNFSVENLIGEGGISRVYKGTLPKEGIEVGVKVLRIDMGMEARRSFTAEVQILGGLRHRNLVRLLGYCSTRDTRAVIMDYMPNGSMDICLKQPKNFNWETRRNIALGVANALAYLHYESVIHCDLKPSNVLLDYDYEPHVADFGISRIAHDEYATISVFRGSIGYAPPEYAVSTQVTTKGDVYSYGILVLEMITGKSPTYDGFQAADNLRDWVKASLLLDFESLLDPNLLADVTTHGDEMQSMLQLALSCASYYPVNRPTMQEVVSTITKLGITEERSFPSLEMLANTPSPYIRPRRIPSMNDFGSEW